MNTPQEKLLAAKGYVTASYVAEKLGRRLPSVYQMATAGKVESIRIGRAWYIKLTSLIEFVGPEAARLLGLAPVTARKSG
jgi:hypothetical protein